MDNIKQKTIAIVRQDVQTFETATAFITTRIAFGMRKLIELFRKNYWGVFDKPKVNNRSKIWIPLTESMVEASVKHADIDTKDINFRARTVWGLGITAVVRAITRFFLDKIGFGEEIDRSIRQLAIDGTIVWKTWKVKEDGKTVMKKKMVDLLNFFIDPVADSIAEEVKMKRVVERSVITVDEIRNMTGWINTTLVKGRTDIARSNQELEMNPTTVSNLAEVHEAWGQFPMFILTGNREDTGAFLGHVVISNLKTEPIVHKIEKVEKVPYEEAWYKRVHGRWYGKGVAEMVMWLQLWLNTIVNIRIIRSYVTQLGLFKIRKGAGITPQQLKKLPVTGAIPVRNMDDIEQMVVQEASQASYKDEEVAYSWAERVTQAFEVVTGEALPASTTATVGAIQDRNARSAFVLVREGIGMFLQRWIKNQAWDIIFDTVENEDIINITGDIEALEDLDERIVDGLLVQETIKYTKRTSFAPREEDIEKERERLKLELRKMGDNRFIKIIKKSLEENLDPIVYVSNEDIDKGVLLQNLNAVLQSVINLKNQDPALDVDPLLITRQIFDVLGVNWNQVRGKAPKVPAGQQLQVGGAMPLPISPEQPVRAAIP